MATANLPAISHPLSRLGSSEKMTVRGVSRGEGATSQIQHELQKVSQLRPITADQMPWRLTKSSCGSRGFHKETNLPALGSVPEGFEMKRASDQSKPAIPIFGKCFISQYMFVSCKYLSSKTLCLISICHNH
jgi:hypothetical protein